MVYTYITILYGTDGIRKGNGSDVKVTKEFALKSFRIFLFLSSKFKIVGKSFCNHVKVYDIFLYLQLKSKRKDEWAALHETIKNLYK